MIEDFILVSPAEVQILAQQWLPRSLGLKMKTDWGCQQPWIPLRTKPIIDGSSAFSCDTTTYYVKIWGTPQRDGPLWKSATTWDFEILKLGRSFDIRPHISFGSSEHLVLWTLLVRHLQLRCMCRSWQSSFKRPLAWLTKLVGCQCVETVRFILNRVYFADCASLNLEQELLCH